MQTESLAQIWQFSEQLAPQTYYEMLAASPAGHAAEHYWLAGSKKRG
jgi:hypothetical protein